MQRLRFVQLFATISENAGIFPIDICVATRSPYLRRLGHELKETMTDERRIRSVRADG